MTNEGIDYTRINPARIEFGVVQEIGPSRTDGKIRIGRANDPNKEEIAFNPTAHKRVCVTGNNEMLWLPGSSELPTVRCQRRVVFERQADGKTAKFWTFRREYLHVLALARTADRYVISYEDDDEVKEQWVGTYSEDFDRRVDIAGQFPTRPTDQHMLWKYNGHGKAVSVRRLTSVEPSWLQKLGFARALA
jgi:hypothetical protein